MRIGGCKNQRKARAPVLPESSLGARANTAIGRRESSPLKHGEDRFKRSWRAIKSLNYGQCRDADAVACAHVQSYALMQTSLQLLRHWTDERPLSLRFYASIFAPRTGILSSRIPSASCRRTSAISTRYRTRLFRIIDASHISACTPRLGAFLEGEARGKRVSTDAILSFGTFSSASRIVTSESRQRRARACGRGRTWVGTRAVPSRYAF